MDNFELQMEELQTWYAAELAKLECKHAIEHSLLDYDMAQKKIELVRKHYKED